MRIHSVGGPVRQFYKILPVIALSIAASSVYSQTALAQDGGVSELKEIVVEGATLSPGGIKIGNLGSSTSVITGEEIEARQITHVADALRSLPGVAVSRTGGFSGLTQVRLRGAEGNHVLVMIDGMEVNSSTDGEFDFSDLLADNIEKIEVIRGPQSGLWGSNALAGVINITTKKGKGPATVSATFENGSFDTSKVSASVRGGNEFVWGAINYSALDSNGFNVSNFGNEDDFARTTNLSATAGMRFNKYLSIRGVLRTSDKTGGFDDISSPPGAALPAVQVAVDAPNVTEHKGYNAKATVQLDLFDGNWSQQFYASDFESDRASVTPLSFFQRSEFLGERRKYGYLSTSKFNTPSLARSNHIVTGLLENEEERFTPSGNSALDGVTRSREMDSVAGEYRGEFADQVFVKGAARYDDSSAFGDFTTYSVSGVVKIDATSSRLRGSVGTGVVFPAMFEQFGVFPGFFTPNPNLLPEESFAWDAGIEQSLLNGMFVVNVTYFEQDLKNEITGFFDAVTFTATSINLAGDSKRKGVEVSTTITPVTDVTIYASYTYLDAKDSTGLHEVRRPKHTGSLKAAYRFSEGKGQVNASVVYNGVMDDVVFVQTGIFGGGVPGRRRLGDYWLVGVAGHYDVHPNVRLFGRVENALDQNYEEIFGFNTPGVAAYAGVKVSFSADDVVE